MNRHRSAGFTLIEILVSLIIMAVGMLGLVGLQLAASQNTQGGYLRGQAALMAYDITDRMRGNTGAVTTGAYNIAAGVQLAPGVSCIGIAADCNTAQLALADLVEWRNHLAVYMPGGNGAVATVDNGTTTTVTVTVIWTDPYSANTGPEQTVIVAELPK